MKDNLKLEIYNLINSNLIDLKKINLKLIKINISKLINVYKKLKIIFTQINTSLIKYVVINKSNSEYDEIIDIINKNFLSSNSQINKIISKSNYIHLLSFSNIYFYWISSDGERNINSHEYLMGLNMFKIALTINEYKFDNNDKITRIIIWIPINKKRDFVYNKITKTNLKKSQEDFSGFVASGVTFGSNQKITIITRYEEVEKLLIHELIHNYNIDGSAFHSHKQMEKILIEYTNIKNDKNYHYEYSIYESYTELLSTYFYLLFENIKKKMEDKDLKNKLLGQILVEIIYSYNVVSNLIDINEYSNYNEFREKKIFLGNICKYEYYYIKALMYNNFILKFGNNLNEFIEIYTDIINMIKKINFNDDPLMASIYTNHIKHYNYKYQIH